MCKIAVTGRLICATDALEYQGQMSKVLMKIANNHDLQYREIVNPEEEICYVNTKYHNKAIMAGRVGKFFEIKK